MRQTVPKTGEVATADLVHTGRVSNNRCRPAGQPQNYTPRSVSFYLAGKGGVADNPTCNQSVEETVRYMLDF
jgi:hypothetical protein